MFESADLTGDLRLDFNEFLLKQQTDAQRAQRPKQRPKHQQHEGQRTPRAKKLGWGPLGNPGSGLATDGIVVDMYPEDTHRQSPWQPQSPPQQQQPSPQQPVFQQQSSQPDLHAMQAQQLAMQMNLVRAYAFQFATKRPQDASR